MSGSRICTLISYFLDVDPPPNVNVALEQVDPSESTNTIKMGNSMYIKTICKYIIIF